MLVISSENLPVKMWLEDLPIEDECIQQYKNLANMPFTFKHVSAMADSHLGLGGPVGCVFPTKRAIIPSVCGVDIGCGMMAVKTTMTAKDLPDDLKKIRSLIEAAVPHGRTDNGGRNDRGAWRNPPKHIETIFSTSLEEEYNRLLERDKRFGKSNCINHLGTLGTGNHFIEICLDESENVWVMLHSGSRGIGNSIGRHYIELAKQDMEKFFINLPDKDLAYIPVGSENYKPYLESVWFAQKFAKLNREIMMDLTLDAMHTAGLDFDVTTEVVNCHHNYVSQEHHFGENILVTRKGAVKAGLGDMGIIPGSMGAKSFIVKGKGNPDSFHSCSHGAGRTMSRTAAKKKFTIEDHIAQTAGVECRKDKDVIDEIPSAYKDIDKVMEAQKDLVDIVHTLKQVLCVKG